MSDEFEDVKSDVADGKEPKTTVRELLRWFGARRRRTGVVSRIRSQLKAAGIVTSPDFTKVWIDADIKFKKAPTLDIAAVGERDTQAEAEAKDANFLVSMLKAANCGVISVKPQDTVEKAITLMLANDYSQLAVMTSNHTLNGTISWKTIGKRLSHENALFEVKDAMEDAIAVEESKNLFQVTEQIIKNEYVFVRSSVNKTISGIVTATDLSEQFQILSEPFLLMGQIENKVRSLLEDKFSTDTLSEACNENDPERKERIQTVADLTFGEYLRIIEERGNWKKLGLKIDRKVFCDEMDKVRKIRNDVMHFDPDGIDEEQYAQLRRFSRLLDELKNLAQ